MATPAMLPDSDPTTTSTPRPVNRKRLWFQASLFLLTLFTTTMVGMRYMANFRQGLYPLSSDADVLPLKWVFSNLQHLGLGLPFSLTLLSILLTHEFAHYFACRRYNIRATLPYLLPAPSLSGTAGAVIRLRSRVKSRAALMAIGASGPIAGFIVATVLTVVGLALSHPVPTEPHKLVEFQSPLLLTLLARLFGNTLHVQLTPTLLRHPVLIASWIGLLITSLNLIPAGQLDGGHILYAISPRAHRITTRIVIAVLIVLGIKCWFGWLVWAALLSVPGMKHPVVDDATPLSPLLLTLAPIALAIFVLTATPQPFTNASLLNLIAHLRHEHSLL